jgi:hypothetical protein
MVSASVVVTVAGAGEVAVVAAGAGEVAVVAVCSANANDVATQSSIAIKTNFFICFTPFCIILLSGIGAGILADIWKDWFTPNGK